MPTTTNVDIGTGVASIGARTDAAGVAVDDITAEEIRLLASVFTEGKVTPADSWKVNAAAPASMNVLVGSGAATTDVFAVAGNIAGQGTYLVRLEAPTETVTIAAADASQQRIDEIYLIVADAPYDGGSVSLPRLGYRKGDAGGSAPGADAAWDAFALLATVTVPAAATEIVAGNIADGRGTSGFVSTIAPYLPLAGGTLTGALTLAGDPTADLHAATKRYVDDAFVTAKATRTAGDIGVNSTAAFTLNIDTNLDLVVAAVAGDEIGLTVNGFWTGLQSVNGFLDMVTRVGGADVNFISSATATPVTTGVVFWFGSGSGGGNVPFSAEWLYTVQAGDLSAGTVTFRLRGKTSSASAKTLAANASEPLRVQAVNYG